jgi:endonuclease/exonuclease/phosphatase (EEP) superfamily protein YafD
MMTRSPWLRASSQSLLSWQGWVYIVGTIAAIATGLGFLERLWWGFSFLAYPRPQYVLLLLPPVLLNLLTAKGRLSTVWALLWAVPLLINLNLVWPFVVAQPPMNMPMDKRLARILQIAQRPHQFSVLHITLDRENPDLSRAIAYINQSEAHLVSVLELTPNSLPQLQTGLTGYQLIGAEPRWNSHGSAWFMRSPAESTHATAAAAQPPAQRQAPRMQALGTEVIHLPQDSDRPLLKATVNVGNKTVHLLCFHAIRPQNAGSVAYQRTEFAALAHWSQQMEQQNKRNLIIIGDFNSTPWASPFRDLMQHSTLVNSIADYGWQPTWHSALPRFLQLPIDHCLHSHSITTFYREIGPDVGSDHVPLRLEVRV